MTICRITSVFTDSGTRAILGPKTGKEATMSGIARYAGFGLVAAMLLLGSLANADNPPISVDNAGRAMRGYDAVAYFAAGRVHMMLGEHDASIGALETSLTLNPNFAQAYHGLGFALTLAGRIEDALDSLAKAERLSPRDPLLWAFTVVHALACILSHDYETAVHWARRAMQIPRATGYWPHAVLAAPLAQLGRIEQARTAVKAALEQKPDLSLSYLKKTLPTKHPGGLDPYLDGLRKAGLPE